MKNIRKIVVIISISAIALAGLLAIGFVFGFVKPTNFLGKACFSLLTVGVSGLLSLNAFMLIESKKNYYSLIGIILVYVCATLLLITIWSSHWKWDHFNKITLLLSISSLFINFVITTALFIGKKLLILQAITYLSLVIFVVCIYLLIYQYKLIGSWFYYLFVTDIIAAIVLMLIISILRKKPMGVNNEEFITIKREEYNQMINKINYLENELNMIKNNHNQE